MKALRSLGPCNLMDHRSYCVDRVLIGLLSLGLQERGDSMRPFLGGLSELLTREIRPDLIAYPVGVVLWINQVFDFRFRESRTTSLVDLISIECLELYRL